MFLNDLNRIFSSESVTRSSVVFSQYQKIQFDSEFLKACALAEKGEALILSLYEQEKLLIAQPVIKRQIPGEAHTYDLISPFEYGTVFSSPDTVRSDWLVFAKTKQKYCQSHSIVSEFYRYSPGDKNVLDGAECVDDHVYLDLEMELTDLSDAWNNSLRKAVKRSFKHEIVCRISNKNSDIKIFRELYFALMKKRQAQSSYFFPSEYFKILLQTCRHAWLFILETKLSVPIAGSIVVGCGDLYYHLLTASDPQYLLHRPNERLLFELFCFCKQKEGAKKLILGGGDTGIKNFKLRFSKLTLPYFVDRQVYSEKLYAAVCDKKNVSVSSNFFPAYRI